MSNEIMNISGVDCYEKDGMAYLNLEAVARGLGFVKKADSGNEVVNWTRVRGYLSDLGVEQKCTTGDYIPENIFYRLAMKAKNETAEKFQALVADEIIPTIRRTGGYVANDELFINTYIPGADEATKQLFRGLLANSRRDAPKVSYFDALIDRGNDLSFRETAKELHIGEREMIRSLIAAGYLYRDKKQQLRPYAETNKGYFTLKEYVNGDKTGAQTLVTVEGRKKIAAMFEKSI
nr:MAG TPA: antirepressor protein [Caudoviricetes sp.]